MGIMDADITGPSIPKMFGVHGQVYGTEDGMVPMAAENGIKIMSVNLLLDNEEDPVIWKMCIRDRYKRPLTSQKFIGL